MIGEFTGILFKDSKMFLKKYVWCSTPFSNRGEYHTFNFTCGLHVSIFYGILGSTISLKHCSLGFKHTGLKLNYKRVTQLKY